MFESFRPRRDKDARRRLAVSTGLSMALYTAIIASVLLLAEDAETAVEAPPIDVTFRPPPPPAPVVVPPAVKVKKVQTPRPVEPLVVPKEVPVQKSPEAGPSNLLVEVPEGDAASGGGRAAPPPPPPPPPPRPATPPPPPPKKEPVNLPENATPPVPDEANLPPEYPPELRANGVEGLVILKVVISEKGEVTKIDVLRGDDPFASAAVSAVKTWRYRAALVDGAPTPVFRIIKVPFRIK